MKQPCLAAFVVMVVAIAGCRKDSETTELPPQNVTKSSSSFVTCTDGRLVFSNIDAFDKTISELMPYDDAQLLAFEARYGCYISYKTHLQGDFEKEDVSFTEDDVLGTILNRYGIVQIEDVAYCVFLKDGRPVTYMALNTAPKTMADLQAHILGGNVVDITGQGIYDNEDKSGAGAGCGPCLDGARHPMGNKTETQYTTAGQKFYFEAKVAYESYGFYNSLYARITHHKWNGVLTPVNFMNIVGCGKNKTRSGQSCIYPSSFPSVPSYSQNKIRYNFSSGSRCARQYYVHVAMGAQRYNEGGVLVNQLMPTYPVERGLGSCY